MARDATQTFVPGVGELYTAPPGTPYPANPAAPAAPWVQVGHTSRENPLQTNRTGGEVTTQGSWQDPAMRTSISPVTWSVAFSLLQYDPPSLKLYYGSNSAVTAEGRVRPPKTPVPTSAALFVRIVDGRREHYRHYDRTEIIAADAEEFDVEKLAALPVSATILGLDGQDHLGEITPPAERPAGATANGPRPTGD
ncbi:MULTISPECIES: hypothetical protein [unclassified Crossiella]|uniref:phage tail tube protein n=1 Tax=unclassified Crossiella TaxID=2620835 RepID=UPI00200022B2|nr:MULTISPECIES: hypothetical protein [unclassified Crossiella]MCK2237708.1 hypothetical protein [Crossiella sp. S99.2]MCK2254994.1 hypothetical protein [Crossiella sp. S99.1]